MQPIIRGIQAVGAVSIRYKYMGNEGKLVLPTDVMRIGGSADKDSNTIDTSKGVDVAGFRLDGEFLRAVQQIASSVQIPILGGGAVALTNNNRSGNLNINATKVSTPAPKNNTGSQAVGEMLKNNGLGPVGESVAYDLVFLAQAQQAQVGGDSSGARIQVTFEFCGLTTSILFEGCTIASVDPIGLSGNDAVNYNVSINYLNWTIDYSIANETQASISALADKAAEGEGEGA